MGLLWQKHMWGEMVFGSTREEIHFFHSICFYQWWIWTPQGKYVLLLFGWNCGFLILFGRWQWSYHKSERIKDLCTFNMFSKIFFLLSIWEILHPYYDVWNSADLIQTFEKYITITDVPILEKCSLHYLPKKNSDFMFLENFRSQSTFHSNLVRMFGKFLHSYITIYRFFICR